MFKEKPTYKGAISTENDRIIVSPDEDVEGLTLRGYGTKEDKGLYLTFYETLYLMDKEIIDIEDKKLKVKMSFQGVLGRYRSLNDNAWIRYLIYKDLRDRGYVVREGFGLGIDFRVYDRGEYGKKTAKYLIFGIQEGKPTSMDELSRALQHGQSLKKKLVLAVINRRGEVVYYSLSQLSMNRT